MTAVWLVTLVAGAVGSESSACGFLKPDAKPVLEIPAGERRAPLALYTIGFSANGHFAWLERRRAVNREKTEWSVHVVDLVNDKFLSERWFEMRQAEVAGLCERYGTAIAAMMEKHGIQPVSASAFEQPVSTADPTGFDVRPGLPNADNGKTPYDVILRSKIGGKRLGSVFRVDITAGEPPLGEPRIRGMLRNPFERRVAIFVLQDMTGTEGVEIPIVTVLGGRLDKGFVQNP